ncbi:hypothetical protein SPBR_06299 [Sporothrix brasiliensis 5110]|uniref:Uncharacterized protein n=1 Tax=Sporothrix brasiliensis 5110 TaxID=1398154 RepID=A0A0C2FS13_9PEZI|nr:uncharacterized protein SPBR_06299 [Sporothrix brasiliensis 5110]KIH93808.1 hypothetical protein SPBR_06299 [Sporothrix brasiliensis 5110]
MNVADTPACGEWGLYTHNTVQITAKHIDMTHNSTVLYEDIDNTLDGGVDATADQAAAALFGCGTDGGSRGVVVNTTTPDVQLDGVY